MPVDSLGSAGLSAVPAQAGDAGGDCACLEAFGFRAARRV